jgi:hypothetical protein
MNNKIIAIATTAIVVLVLVLAFYFATRPIAEKHSEDIPKTTTQNDHVEPSESQKPLPANEAHQDFLTWKKDEDSSLQAQDERLQALSESFPKDYRFPLERVRGAAKVKGIHSHTEEFELLADAARIAIECECGDTKKMLDDLNTHRGDKTNGFWKLSTHPKQWDPIIEALRKEDVDLLSASESGGQHNEH